MLQNLKNKKVKSPTLPIVFKLDLFSKYYLLDFWPPWREFHLDMKKIRFLFFCIILIPVILCTNQWSDLDPSSYFGSEFTKIIQIPSVTDPPHCLIELFILSR